MKKHLQLEVMEQGFAKCYSLRHNLNGGSFLSYVLSETEGVLSNVIWLNALIYIYTHKVLMKTINLKLQSHILAMIISCMIAEVQ